MKIIPYKDRQLILEQPFYFYRCLTRKGYFFSIKQDGLVIGHTDSIIIKNCDLIINEKKKKKCIDTKKRNVHAFIKGYIGNTDDVKSNFSFILNYNPYDVKKFHINDSEITKCSVVYIQENKLMCQI